MGIPNNNTELQCLFLTYYEMNKTPALVTIYIAASVWNIFLLMTAIIANGFVCTAIVTNHELRTTWNTLIGVLSVSDFLVAATVQPLYLVRRLMELQERYRCWVVVTYRVLWHLSIGTSFLVLCLIACERYIALFFTFKYKQLVTISRILYLTGFLVASWTVFVISRFIGLQNETYYAAATCFIVVFIGVITVAYVRIFKLARRHHTQIGVMSVETSSKIAREQKLTKTTAYIVGSVLTCYSPLLISIVTMKFFSEEIFHYYVFPITDCMVFCNSSLNPLIYCWRNAELRRRIAKLLMTARFSISLQKGKC